MRRYLARKDEHNQPNPTEGNMPSILIEHSRHSSVHTYYVSLTEYAISHS